MNILSLNDWAVRRLRTTHPAFAGTKLLARGTFCAVFAMPDPTRVLKLTTDPAHASYLTDGLAPEGEYKPQVLADYGNVGETEHGLVLYLFEVERLGKLQPGSPARRLAGQLLRYLRTERRWPEESDEMPGMPAPMGPFLRSLNWLIDNYPMKADPKLDNFMQRADGTLVLSDPVYDAGLYDREGRRQAQAYAERHQGRYAYAYG